MSEVNVAKIFASLGFNFDEQSFKKFDFAIKGAVAGLMLLARNSAQVGQRLQNLFTRTGVNEEFANSYMRMAETVGVSSDSVVSAIENISSAQANFRQGEGNIQPWALLGIDPTAGNPEEVFDSILNKIKDIDDIQLRTKRLEDLGLDPLLAKLSNIPDFNIAKNLFLKKEDIKSLQDLSTQLAIMKTNLSLLKDKFIACATPIKWFFEVVNRVIFGFSNLIEKTIGVDKFAKILTGTIITLFAILSPKLTILSALLILVDDFLTYLRGGQSVIGQYIDKLKELWEETSILQKIMIAFAGSLAGLLIIKSLINPFGLFIKSLTGIAGIGGIINKALITPFKMLPAIINAILSPLGLLTTSLLFFLQAKDIGSWVGEKISGIGKLAEESKNKIQSSIQDVYKKALSNPELALNILNNKNQQDYLNQNPDLREKLQKVASQVNNNNITFNITGDNAKQISKEVNNNLETVIDNSTMIIQ